MAQAPKVADAQSIIGNDTFRCQISSDVDGLELLHQKTKWIPGQVNIRPKAAEKKAKNEKINAEQAEYASGMDYIFDHVFECESKKDDSGLLAVSNKEKLQQEVFKPNRFPYHLHPKTQHYVMWYSSGDETTISAEKITKDINKEIKKIVDKDDSIDKKDKDNYDFVWYFNPKMTVSDVYHAQVFWIANKNDINKDDDESDAKTGDEKVPDDGLGLTVDNSTVINGESILRVTVNAPSYDAKESDEDRLGTTVCCVVDVSGSMGTTVTIKNDQGKTESHGLTILDLVKHSIKTIIHCLGGQDKLSIVSYSTNVASVIKLTAMTEDGKKKALAALDTLHPTSSTALWAGLEAGLEELDEWKPIRKENSGVLLFTDGMPNIRPGIGEVGSLEAYIKDKCPNGILPGIVHTYGFGYSLDSVLLNELAIKGLGSYFFIPDSSFVGTIFVNSVSNLCANAARNVELTLNVPKDSSFSVLGNFKHTVNGEKVKIDLGSVMYGQNKTVMIKFDKDDDDDDEEEDDNNEKKNNQNGENEGQVETNIPDDKKSGDLKDVKSMVDESSLQYISLKTGKQVTKAVSYEIKKNKKQSLINYYRLKSCDAIREAMESMQLNDKDEAQTNVKKLIKDMSKDNKVKNDEFIKDLLKDLKGQVFEAIETVAAYKKWGRHYLLSLMSAHLHQYNNNFKDPGVQHYGGTLFRTIKEKSDKIFVDLPPPVPSGRPQAQYQQQQQQQQSTGGARPGKGKGRKNKKSKKSANSSYAAPKINMRTYYNASGGCIGGDCKVLLNNGELKFVKDLVKGDKLFGNCEILCALRMKVSNSLIELCKFQNGLKITPWHPVKFNNKWVFPNNINSDEMGKSIECCDYVYNFILNKGHSMIVNGIECVTLGHGKMDNDVLAHEYFGSFSKISNDLNKIKGWNSGMIDLTSDSFQRNQDNLVVKIA